MAGRIRRNSNPMAPLFVQRNLRTWMRTLLPWRLRGAKQDEVLLGTAACMLGAVVLARALGGEDGDSVLEQSRAFVERALASKAR